MYVRPYKQHTVYVYVNNGGQVYFINIYIFHLFLLQILSDYSHHCIVLLGTVCCVVMAITKKRHNEQTPVIYSSKQCRGYSW